MEDNISAAILVPTPPVLTVSELDGLTPAFGILEMDPNGHIMSRGGLGVPTRLILSAHVTTCTFDVSNSDDNVGVIAFSIDATGVLSDVSLFRITFRVGFPRNPNVIIQALDQNTQHSGIFVRAFSSLSWEPAFGSNQVGPLSFQIGYHVLGRN